MSFPQLRRFKQENKEVAELLTRLELYLEEVLNSPLTIKSYISATENLKALQESQNHLIHPRNVAHYLKIDQTLAIALLRICDKAGIVSPRYDIYCPETEGFIKSYFSLLDLPESIFCPNHDHYSEHLKDEYLVDFMFFFTMNAIMNHFTFSR